MQKTYLPHVDGNLTALAYYPRGVFSRHPIPQMRQYFGRSNSTEGLCRFVADHVGLCGVLEDLQQRRNGVRGEELPENEGDFVPLKLR